MPDKSKEVIAAEINLKKAQAAMNDAQNALTLSSADYHSSMASLQVARKNEETVRIKNEIDSLNSVGHSLPPDTDSTT